MRILIVEDEQRVAEDIAGAVKASGYVPELCHDGEEAWFRGGTETYAAIVLDLGLPKLDGVTVLRRWRQEGVNTPVIVLTARGSWTERVDGIDAGADDYLPKPFRMEELMARLRALLRRVSGHAQPVITAGEVTLDPRSRLVTVRGVPLQLTPLEYRALAYLMHQAGKTVSQVELADNLYEHDHERDSNAVEALIGRLRKKLKADVIETRRGFGYAINAGGT
jgi:DNA-binding response OmpR family regulator